MIPQRRHFRTCTLEEHIPKVELNCYLCSALIEWKENGFHVRGKQKMANYIVAGIGGESRRSETQRTWTAAASHQQLQTDFFPQGWDYCSGWQGSIACPGAHRLTVHWHWDRRKREWDMNSKSLFHSAEVPKSAMPYHCTDSLQQVLLCYNTVGILSNI